MNAPRALPCVCPWCAEPAPTLYEHDDAEICGQCLDAALAPADDALTQGELDRADVHERPDYAPDAWRRF